MLFKNATVYQFTKTFELDEDVLLTALSSNAISEIQAEEVYRLGWDTYTKRTDDFFLNVKGCYLIRLTKLEKIIPPQAINKELSDLMDEIEVRDNRKVTRKERQELKEQIILAHLPTAMVKEKSTLLYIDPANQLLAVNSASKSETDEATSYLRKCLGSLPIRNFEITDTSPVLSMTNWLKDESIVPSGFSIYNSAKLKDHDGSSITYKGFTDENVVTDLIDQGMQCTELEMGLSNNEMKFTLTDDLKLKSIKWNVEADDYEDAEAQLSAAFFLTTTQIRVVSDKLFKAA